MAHAGGPPSAAVASAAAVIALCVLEAAAVKRRERGNGALPSWVLRAGGEDAGGGLAERHATVGTEAARRSVPALEELQLGLGGEEESVKDAMLAAFKAGDLAVHMFHPTRAWEKLKSVHDKGRFYEALSTSQIRPEYAGFETYNLGRNTMGWLLHLPSCRVHLASSADLFVQNGLVVGEERQWYLTHLLKERTPNTMHSVLGTEHGPAMRHLVYDPDEEAWARTLCDEPMEGNPLRCYNSSDAGAFEAIKKAMLAEVRPVIKSHGYTGNPHHRDRRYWTEVVAACPLEALVGIVVLRGVRYWYVDEVGELLGKMFPYFSGKKLMVAKYVPYREGVNQTGGRTEEAALDFRFWIPRYKDVPMIIDQNQTRTSTGTENIDQNQHMQFDSPLPRARRLIGG